MLNVAKLIRRCALVTMLDVCNMVTTAFHTAARFYKERIKLSNANVH